MSEKMTEQEACGQKILGREEAMNTTLGDLLDMRSRLNSALKDKLGREADSYFNIEMNSHCNDRISFCLAYPSLSSGYGAVVGSMTTFRTPQEAFNHAMIAIENLKIPTNQDKIDKLKKQIKELESE